MERVRIPVGWAAAACVGLVLLTGCGSGDHHPGGSSSPAEQTWHLDSDGDGYGDPDVSVQAVSAPPGYVRDGTDCDDEAFTVHPGSYEICEDGIDQDCDGRDGAFTDVGHAQGEMAGEVTATSVILQSRLTASCSLIRGDMPGMRAEACFEISRDPEFQRSFLTEWTVSLPENDFIVKTKVTGLEPGTRYYYRLLYRQQGGTTQAGPTCTFRTLDGPDAAAPVRFAVVTGMNWFVFRFLPPRPPDRELGYPALESILERAPDFLVATGDNVYYDAFPVPARSQAELRRVWHWQFVQPRFLTFFSRIPVYWEKDDHDFRYNDADGTGTIRPRPELGIRTFLEQVPVADPEEPGPITYRTHRINRLVQIWLTEGRDYRSPNMMEDGPDKSLWGKAQRQWLQESLLASDATFKLLISPTPMIGPDDMFVPWPAPGQDLFKRDNHTNPKGFKHEGEAFFAWLSEHGFQDKNFYILCGDRHWQYHSIRPDGFEEFSCGAICDANARLGRNPGDLFSTDPEARITQPYTQAEASGGFLEVTVRPGTDGGPATCEFTFYDEHGVLLYTVTRTATGPG